VKISDFDFDLPKSLIAQAPAKPRDHARLLVYDRSTKVITDDHFYNLDKYLPAKTSLVVNDSKVEKCRLRFGATEVFVTRTINPTTVEALVRPGKKFKIGAVAGLADGITAKTVAIDGQGLRILELSRPLDSEVFDKYRLTPLPPYIKQDEGLSGQYQTVYADPLGSKAAPTAGLHFTDNQLEQLVKAHQIIKLTLHVGLGTFAPVKAKNIAEHRLHSEEFLLSAAAATQLNKASHITAVGTTSVRVLESLNRPFSKTAGSTDIFIKPGYKFRAVDSLVTNFHLPKSSLLILVSALVGSVEEVQRIYAHAVKQQYRFYSFGDAMLIL
jgi:S-adenosylmethionine:tRNA ribosyltransferase-isomerase